MEESIISAISSMGFPAMVSFYLLFRVNTTLQSLNTSIQRQTAMSEKIIDTLRETRESLRKLEARLDHLQELVSQKNGGFVHERD